MRQGCATSGIRQMASDRPIAPIQIRQHADLVQPCGAHQRPHRRPLGRPDFNHQHPAGRQMRPRPGTDRTIGRQPVPFVGQRHAWLKTQFRRQSRHLIQSNIRRIADDQVKVTLDLREPVRLHEGRARSDPQPPGIAFCDPQATDRCPRPLCLDARQAN